jgi:hypothetical protein
MNVRNNSARTSELRAVEQIENGDLIERFHVMPIGRALGGKCGSVVACKVCGRPAWHKSELEYVHEAETRLDRKNNPQTEITSSCKIPKNQPSAKSGK